MIPRLIFLFFFFFSFTILGLNFSKKQGRRCFPVFLFPPADRHTLTGTLIPHSPTACPPPPPPRSCPEGGRRARRPLPRRRGPEVSRGFARLSRAGRKRPPCLQQPALGPGRAGPGRGHRRAPPAHVPAAPAAHGSDGGTPQPGERGEGKGWGRIGSAGAAPTAGRG